MASAPAIKNEGKITTPGYTTPKTVKEYLVDSASQGSPYRDFIWKKTVVDRDLMDILVYLHGRAKAISKYTEEENKKWNGGDITTIANPDIDIKWFTHPHGKDWQQCVRSIPIDTDEKQRDKACYSIGYMSAYLDTELSINKMVTKWLSELPGPSLTL